MCVGLYIETSVFSVKMSCFTDIDTFTVKSIYWASLCRPVTGRVSPSTRACPPVDSGSPTLQTSPAPPHTPGKRGPGPGPSWNRAGLQQPKQRAAPLHKLLLITARLHKTHLNIRFTDRPMTKCCKQDKFGQNELIISITQKAEMQQMDSFCHSLLVLNPAKYEEAVLCFLMLCNYLWPCFNFDSTTVRPDA